MGFDIDNYLERCYKGELLEELVIKLICLKLKEIFIHEPNIKYLKAPVTVVGDVHGQFLDLKELFDVGGYVPYTNYLFLGDYVDRGPASIEVITLLSVLKLKYPERVTLIRGNHETKGITQNYGFYMECQTKYGNTQVWEYFTDMFDYLPIGALINETIFCVHGGLSPALETEEDIAQLDRYQEIPHDGPFTDLMWSDPDGENPGFTISPRGAGYLFGEDVFERFLHLNNYTCVLRAHQLCNDGYVVMFKERLFTVWSAPNYLFRFGKFGGIFFYDESLKKGNLASILEIDENLEKYFNVFTDSPENAKKEYNVTNVILPQISNIEKQYFM